MSIVENIFNHIPEKISKELCQTLLYNNQIKIERVISKGHSSAVNDWYDQIQDEWVIVLEGQAILQFESSPCFVTLKSGDYLLIPAHKKHRVHWTDPDHKTIWLCVFMECHANC